jgi:hypothetical protein
MQRDGDGMVASSQTDNTLDKRTTPAARRLQRRVGRFLQVSLGMQEIRHFPWQICHGKCRFPYSPSETDGRSSFCVCGIGRRA